MNRHPKLARPVMGAALTALFALVGAALLAAIATAGSLNSTGGGEEDQTAPGTSIDSPQVAEISAEDAPDSPPSAEPEPVTPTAAPVEDSATTETSIAVEPEARVGSATTTSSEPDPTPVPVSTEAFEPPPVPALFEPSANEVQPEAKMLGARIAHRLTNYEADTTIGQLASAVTTEPDRTAALVESAAPLYHARHWSRGAVEYAQLGGHANDRASIMVVVAQTVGDAEGVETTWTRTLDVRVEKIDGVWHFDQLADAGGTPVARPAGLSPEAAAVVDDPRIRIPDSALWDIYEGHTHVTLLKTMAALADVTPYSAVVLRNGHPYHVFETERLSNHSVGRAIDIYKLGDELVVQTREPGSFTNEVVEWIALRPELRELGSPWTVEDAVARTFTNEVHQDHIHIGVNPID